MSPLHRCQWATSPLSIPYHDTEWGVPLHDDQKLFEFLILEGAQAGLSWETVLKKRERYRQVFDHFNIEKIARYDHSKLELLMQDSGIIRNRAKLEATVNNAQKTLALLESFDSLDRYLWQFCDGSPRLNAWHQHEEVPSHSAISDAMSKELKRRGFKFVGTTICYAFMQATGMVNDHLTDCFRYHEINACPSP